MNSTIVKRQLSLIHVIRHSVQEHNSAQVMRPECFMTLYISFTSADLVVTFRSIYRIRLCMISNLDYVLLDKERRKRKEKTVRSS